MKPCKNLCSKDNESIRKSVEKSFKSDDRVSAGAGKKNGKLERRIRVETRCKAGGPIDSESLSAAEHWFGPTHACGHTCIFARSHA